jgi:predicted regulator of Ras-like GTPase activity (Roadblock/LC7/MglB family)
MTEAGSATDVIRDVRRLLAECVQDLPRSLCAFLATCDGHLIDMAGHYDKTVVMASLPMAGSLLGLGKSIAGDLQENGRLDDVIVRSGQHILSLVTVGDDDDVLFVGVLADRMVNLGQMLVRSKQVAEAIRALL